MVVVTPLRSVLPRLRGTVLALVPVTALASLLPACGEEAHRVPPPASSDLEDPVCTSCGDCEEAFEIVDRRHVTGGVAYDDYPPPGGIHDPCWAPWGIHESEVPVERWVHNLEHGGIVYLYSPGDDAVSGVSELEAIVQGNGRTLIAPDSRLETTFAALAWGHRLLSSCFDRDAAEQFLERRFAQAPEDLDGDPPASCR